MPASETVWGLHYCSIIGLLSPIFLTIINCWLCMVGLCSPDCKKVQCGTRGLRWKGVQGVGGMNEARVAEAVVNGGESDKGETRKMGRS